MASTDPLPTRPRHEGALDALDDVTVARAVARRSLERRELAAVDEVERLLRAGLAALADTSTARVSDIVRVAGLSNSAFYRHFSSKDELVEAIMQDGARRLASYAAHQMSKHDSAEAKVRRWVECVMAQARDPVVAAQTRAMLTASGATSSPRVAAGERRGADLLAAPLREPIAVLGSRDPDRHAVYVAELALAVLNRALAGDAAPTAADVDTLTRFCLVGIDGSPGKVGRSATSR